jgi:hypothetical protein
MINWQYIIGKENPAHISNFQGCAWFKFLGSNHDSRLFWPKPTRAQQISALPTFEVQVSDQRISQEQISALLTFEVQTFLMHVYGPPTFKMLRLVLIQLGKFPCF